MRSGRGLPRRAGSLSGPSGPATPADADRAVAVLYGLHYRSLVRLAALLVPDLVTAETIVQDAFVELHAAWTAQHAPWSGLHARLAGPARGTGGLAR